MTPRPRVPTAGGSAGSTSVPGAAQHSSEARGLGTRQGRGGLPNPFRERQGDTHPALSGSPVGPAFRQQAAPCRDGPILPRSYVPCRSPGPRASERDLSERSKLPRVSGGPDPNDGCPWKQHLEARCTAGRQRAGTEGVGGRGDRFCQLRAKAGRAGGQQLPVVPAVGRT